MIEAYAPFFYWMKHQPVRALSFSFLILLKLCSTEWLTPPQNVHSVWTSCALSLSLSKPELPSIFRKSVFDRDIERAHDVQTEWTFCGDVNQSAEQCFKKVRKEKEKSCAVDVSSYRQMERTHRKCFRCGYEDHMIAKCPKQVCFNEKGNYARDNGENESNCKIYAYMAQMSSNGEWKNHGKTEYWDRSFMQEGW